VALALGCSPVVLLIAFDAELVEKPLLDLFVKLGIEVAVVNQRARTGTTLHLLFFAGPARGFLRRGAVLRLRDSQPTE
jgi:hypothetical protein